MNISDDVQVQRVLLRWILALIEMRVKRISNVCRQLLEEFGPGFQLAVIMEWTVKCS